VGQDGKRPPALIVFAQVTLNIDQITAAKFIALVFAVLDDVNAVVAPVAKHGSSLIFLGSLSQIQYNAQQGWGHGFSPFKVSG
jgi:hypothetical protein